MSKLRDEEMGSEEESHSRKRGANNMNIQNLKIDKIQAKIDNMIARIESDFMVSRKGLVDDLGEIQDILEGMRQ